MDTRQATLVSRPIEFEDGDAVAEVLNAFFEDIGRVGQFTGDGVRSRMVTPNFDPQTHSRLVLTEDDYPIGYAFLWNLDGCDSPARLIWVVHPDYRDTDTGLMLLSWAEQQMMLDLVKCQSSDVIIQVESLSEHDGSHDLYERFGYKIERYFREMAIDLDGKSPSPSLPNGLHVRGFDLQRDTEAVYRSMREIFKGHWGFSNVPFDTGLQKFEHEIENDPQFDPTLWFLMVHDDEIVGMGLCKQSVDADSRQVGYISRFGISPAWRRQGLGLILLHYVLQAFFERGCSTVTLDVDAANESGATRLYEKAGMSAAKQWKIYQKMISKG